MSFAANKADSGNLIERSHANWVNQAENQAIKFKLWGSGSGSWSGSMDRDMVMELELEVELDLEPRKLHFFSVRSAAIRFDSFQFHSIYGIRNCAAI